jgi:hypothetical protein
MVTENPNLISRRAMEAMQTTGGSAEPLLSEILQKVNNAKDKPKKIEVLKQYDSDALRMIIKGAFDPNIKWALPEGRPPFIENDVPKGTEHGQLKNECKRLWHFIEGADVKTSKTQKETMFIQMLEGLHKEEAELLMNVKDKKLNKVYKGLTASAVQEAFNWDDKFIKKEQK